MVEINLRLMWGMLNFNFWKALLIRNNRNFYDCKIHFHFTKKKNKLQYFELWIPFHGSIPPNIKVKNSTKSLKFPLSKSNIKHNNTLQKLTKMKSTFNNIIKRQFKLKNMFLPSSIKVSNIMDPYIHQTISLFLPFILSLNVNKIRKYVIWWSWNSRCLIHWKCVCVNILWSVSRWRWICHCSL
jgi:hypothetical protein